MNAARNVRLSGWIPVAPAAGPEADPVTLPQRSFHLVASMGGPDLQSCVPMVAGVRATLTNMDSSVLTQCVQVQ